MYLDTIKIVTAPREGSESIDPLFFTNKTIEQNEDHFEVLDPGTEINQEVQNYMEDREEGVKKKLSSFGPVVSNSIWDALAPERELSMIKEFFRESSSLLIYGGPETDGQILAFFNRNSQPRRTTSINNYVTRLQLVAESSDDCQNFVQFMKSEIESISEVVGEFVSLDGLSNGVELVKEYLDSHDQIQSWETTESQNDFEENVQLNVEEFVGPSIRNVRVYFDSGNGEYDVVALPLGGQGSKFAIEAKNFQSVQQSIDEEERESELSADNLQSKLINQPKVSAERIGLSLIMIVNDIPEQTYASLQSQASPIGVTLLNNEDHREGLDEQLVTNTIQDITE
ncbi:MULTISPECIES: hypothetical protein [Halococcus]|uniref:hypothetical protein n=1 Tax=Halococcus TaxID=2249 RepID=UPI001267F224|nr:MULTISPECIES: hypothetical protein [Halococcus]